MPSYRCFVCGERMGWEAGHIVGDRFVCPDCIKDSSDPAVSDLKGRKQCGQCGRLLPDTEVYFDEGDREHLCNDCDGMDLLKDK